MVERRGRGGCCSEISIEAAARSRNRSREKRQDVSWIRQIPIDEATGFLKRQFDAALERAGRVWKIVHVMSVNPRVLEASISLYGALMTGRSPLSRAQRELLATVTSAELGCRY